MKRLVTALAASTMLAIPAIAATPSLPAPIDLGELKIGNDIAATINAQQFNAASGTAFTQEYTFTLADRSDVYASLLPTNIRGKWNATDMHGIIKKNGVQMAAFNDAQGVTNIFQSMSKTPTYSLTVFGTSTGPIGGAFKLSLKATAAAPVPGPAAWMVGLAGAGLVAFQLRRRTKKATVSFA